MEENFGVKAKLEKIRIQGKEEKRVIIARLSQWEDKVEIMRKKKNLGDRKIYINHDLTIEERMMQRKLSDIAKEKKQKNNRVKIGYRKLCINGNWKSWEDIKQRLSNTSQERQDF